MIRIHPEIAFAASCPVDGTDLDISGIEIPGMRCLADSCCPSCGSRYFVDLPVGQAIRSPVTLNQATGEIYDARDVTWFSDLLQKSLQEPVETAIVPVIHTFQHCDRIVIINCLDFLYGHSLLKLLNVQRYLDEFPDLGCCVLVPSQLLHLVPAGVAEIWEFPVPAQHGWQWYRSLQTWMKQQLLTRRECFLSRAYSHPGNRFYDLNRFVRNVPDISQIIARHHPVILFSYRQDRLWGRDISQQQRNIQKLYNSLGTVFPEMAFVITGFGKNPELVTNGPGIIDLRCDGFDREQDLLWLAYMQTADCAVGIHGSNMLLPSGLARATVELMPRSRIGNSIQDLLFLPAEQDPRDALLFYRLLYGNDSLSDVQPSAVVDLVVCMVASARYNSFWFKVGESAGAMDNANAVSETAVFTATRNYFSTASVSSYLKRKGRQIAERILEIID